MSRAVADPQSTQRQGLPVGLNTDRISWWRWLAIVLEKQHNIRSRWHRQQALPDAHQDVVCLIRFGFGRFDFCDSEGVTLAIVTKLTAPVLALLLDGYHVRAFSVILLQSFATCRRANSNTASRVLYHKVLCSKYLQRENNATAT